MKIKLNLSILFLIFFATSFNMRAQIYKEKDEVIKELGTNYESDITESGRGVYYV